MDILPFVLLAVFPALVIMGALSDVATMTIPNRISLALIVLFFPAAFLAGMPFAQVAACVGVGLVGLAVGMVMFALRWIGGGDAKMTAAAAMWLGVAAAPHFLLWTGVAGGLFAVFLLMARAHGQLIAGRAPRWVGRLLEPKGDIPYGVAICAGALMAFPHSGMFLAATGSS